MAGICLPRRDGLHRMRRHGLSRTYRDTRTFGLDRPIRELILEKKPTSEIRKLAQREGMSFLRESALERVRRGVTTLKEINKVTFIEASR